MIGCSMPCAEYYNYTDISGNICRGCECVSSVDCPQLHCECPEEYKLDTDINDCPTCRCVSQQRRDQDDLECPMRLCVQNCPSGYEKDDQGCQTCKCLESRCPKLKCNLDCTESGYKLDNNGCAICECFVNQCPMIDCVPCPKYYNYEVIEGNMCRGCDCVDSVECPALGCECPEGYKQDTGMDGCAVCRCVPEEPKCPELNCDLDCTESGYKADGNGCRMCECYRNPCPMVHCLPCPKYYNYEVIEGNMCRGCDCVDSVECPALGCECPEGYKQDTGRDGCPICRCVPEEPRCPELNCDLNCNESGYKLDDNGCAMCECYRDPCPMFRCRACPEYYNYTNIEGNICRACQCVSSVQCPKLQCGCLEGTTQDTDINGCPTCRCVSQGRRDQDDLGCPMRLCVKNCPSGYEKDDQGCQTCKCLSTRDNYYIFIIVGCLVALIIVCGIVGIVLYRRRGKNNHSVSSNGIVKEPLNEKYLAVPAVDMSINDVKNPKVKCLNFTP